MTMTKTDTKPKQKQVLEDIDMGIYEKPEPPKIEIGDPLLNVLSTDAEKNFRRWLHQWQNFRR